ncbi:prepilin-type N-cleavage/methylation domain-containing protein [Salmonella enterica subsp. enterica serovar Typhi]|nr:putative PilV-like protein [Salmonella enterica subsp. enterica serovar Typhi str. Ty21a]OBR70038.1 pilus assembly protein PilV [Salmonella enterica subsp. enterica serovar Typhi]CIC89192.1 prepilin-type N-cleavage/methylation domain-containing protein [Salmonella enterica subsp. enterica serovar Enteritidis]OKK34594.1 pilus assembly protein PilV [Salmonella enterica subsp. enterica serovar Typhi]OKK36464.1 pilus assembly protein PilV [Salmonella enterica subsp. enterica serovar Typhi]
MAMKMKKQNKKGFSLLELILVLGVGSMMAFMRFQDMKTEQENVMAKAVGQQMKQIGEAVNGYINIRYDKLSTLTSSSSQSSDPGPRTCNGSGCEITYQTLINEGLLPTAYTGINVKKSPYKILLKRDGTAPNYVINGLITTSTAWIEGGKTRYDLLGNAMQTAGIDSGMTKTTSIASGYSGQWTETSANFNNITSTGQLAFRVGFNSALYSVYLRRDGTLPMTGDLNLDGHNINNIANINATGNITTTSDLQARNIKATGKVDADGDISSGRYLIAKSKDEDASIKIGGDGTGNHNFMFESQKRTSVVFFPSVNSALLTYKFRGNINILSPSGDSVGVKLNGTTGNITASGNIEAAQNVKGATLESTGRATVGEFVQLNGQAEVGKVCQSNGLQGRTAKGKILSCVNGVWTGSVQINNSQCKWFSPANAFSYFGEYSGQLHEKPIICPAGYIMTGSKMWGWAEDVDDEHVDIYCCPLS